MPSPKAKDVDQYVARASEHTRPILVKLRRIFRRASPKLQEAIKWGIPCYVYKGPVGGFAAYTKHVSWGLWKARLLNDPDGLIGQRIVMGGRIEKVSDIPPASKLIGLIKQVIALNEAGIKNPKPPDPKLPADFAAAMKRSGEAAKHYAAFTPARKWQYVNWINQAKRPETRAKRIAAAVERIGAGKKMK
jgi:uncharacterized protein YdeI (YjbR/CyaY-like superfamily)